MFEFHFVMLTEFSTMTSLIRNRILRDEIDFQSSKQFYITYEDKNLDLLKLMKREKRLRKISE